MFSIKHFIKVFIITALSILLMLCGLMGIAVMQRQKIANLLMDELSSQLNIPLKHSAFDFSLAKNFPLASMVLHNISVMYPSAQADTLLHINELMVSFNLIDVVNRNYQIRGLKLNGGTVNIRSNQLHTINQPQDNSKSSNDQPTTPIQFDHIAINNIRLRYFDNDNRQTFGIGVDKTKIFIKLQNNNLTFQLKGTAQISEPKTTIHNTPFTIEAAVNKHNNTWNIDALNVIHKHISLYSKGQYAPQQLNLRFATDPFKANKVANILGIRFIESGMCKANGQLLFSNGAFNTISIHHSSNNIGIKIGNDKLIVGQIDGHTKFTHNFKQHYSNIEHISLRLGDTKAEGTLRAKGLHRMALLADMELCTKGIPMAKLPKGWDFDAQGHTKLLTTLDLTDPNKIEFHVNDTRTELQLHVANNPLLPSLTNLHGQARVGKHIELHTQGMLQNKPIEAAATIHNALKIINNQSLNSINASIRCTHLNLDNLIAEIGKQKSDSGNTNIAYKIDYEVDTLQYLNKKFNSVSGRFYEYNDTLYADRLNARLYSGRLSDGMVAISPNGELGISGRLEQMDVSALFADNNNFKQQIVTAQNISGTLNADIRMRFATNQQGVDMQSLRLASNVELHNGRLRGMDKIKQLNKWLNLSEVKSIDFNTLTNTIIIDTGWVHIPAMDITSNVLGIKLDGQHSFRGPFNYHIKLNVAQLLANRFLNKSGAGDFERQRDNGLFLNLLISGDGNGYQIKRDKARSKQQIKTEVSKERALLQNIMREEFGRKRDTAKATTTDTIVPKPKPTTGYRVVWDDEDED